MLPRGGKLDLSRLDGVVSQIRQAREWSAGRGEITWDTPAGKLWDDIYPTLSFDHPGLFGSIVNRAEAVVCRLATIYAALDRSSKITKAHLLAAVSFWEYAQASANYIFGSALGDPIVDGILKALRARPTGLTRTEINRHFQGNKNAEELGQALDLLCDLGKAQSEEEFTTGRPRVRYYSTAPVS